MSCRGPIDMTEPKFKKPPPTPPRPPSTPPRPRAKTRRVHLKPDPAKMVEHERGEHADSGNNPQKGRGADGGGGGELGQDQQDTQKTAEPRPPRHLPELRAGGDFEFSQREAAREQAGGADEQGRQGRRDRQAERLRQRRVLSGLDRVGETGEDRQGVEGPQGRSSGPRAAQVSPLRHRSRHGRVSGGAGF